MSGICSAHQWYQQGCPRCETLPGWHRRMAAGDLINTPKGTTMASKTRPAVTQVVDQAVTGEACIRFTGADALSGDIVVWFDPRGGLNIQADDSLIIHPRTGRSMRVVAGDDQAR